MTKDDALTILQSWTRKERFGSVLLEAIECAIEALQADIDARDMLGTTILEAVRDGVEIRCEGWVEGMTLQERLFVGPPGLGEVHQWIQRLEGQEAGAALLTTEDLLRIDWQVVERRPDLPFDFDETERPDNG